MDLNDLNGEELIKNPIFIELKKRWLDPKKDIFCEECQEQFITFKYTNTHNIDNNK